MALKDRFGGPEEGVLIQDSRGNVIHPSDPEEAVAALAIADAWNRFLEFDDDSKLQELGLIAD